MFRVGPSDKSIYDMINMQQMNLRGIDLNLLAVLHALLTEESVSRAALRVGLSQPATSHALARLRALFDDALLERRDGKLCRTAFASVLLPRVCIAVQSAQAVFREPGPFDPASITATVRLAATDYVSTLLLPDVLRRLSAEAPGLDLRVTVTDRLAVGDALTSGRADLALGVFGRSTPGFRTEDLFNDDLILLARRGHPILSVDRLTPEDLARYDWMLVSPFGDPVGPVDEALRARGIARRVRLTVPIFLQAPEIVARTDLVVALGRRLGMIAIGRWPVGWRELPLQVPGFTANAMWLDQRDTDPVLSWLRARLHEDT